jgi:hypothetical protein
MSYADALQIITLQCDPEVSAAINQKHNDLVRDHLRTLGDHGRLIDRIKELSANLAREMRVARAVGGIVTGSDSTNMRIQETQSAARRLK